MAHRGYKLCARTARKKAPYYYCHSHFSAKTVNTILIILYFVRVPVCFADSHNRFSVSIYTLQKKATRLDTLIGTCKMIYPRWLEV